MEGNLVLQNFLNPTILFFFLGALAKIVKSDLEIPQPIPKFLSLYLLMAIGFKGGVELHSSGISGDVILSLGVAVFMAFVVPVYSFYILRRKFGIADSAAIAATYGSISAVTFITATSFLGRLDISYGGHLVAAMALMESPAIIVGVLLYRYHNKDSDDESGNSWKEILREAFLNGSVFLIMGSLVIGFVTGEDGAKTLTPFTNEIFKGMLAFFLLDMGIVAAKRLEVLKSGGLFIISFAIILPLFNAFAGIGIAHLIGMTVGDALLFSILCASGSYIAVPAAIRLTIPEANPSFYIPMALGITFPFNIILGLPLYLWIIELLWS
ncbi:MAG: sodium-dependent bicarbonate transport family permease [Melioribacteraceae bacterium]|nr:sodium-dependent bicarbonate transport family permease [Melioribacteraceae bacterium]